MSTNNASYNPNPCERMYEVDVRRLNSLCEKYNSNWFASPLNFRYTLKWNKRMENTPRFENNMQNSHSHLTLFCCFFFCSQAVTLRGSNLCMLLWISIFFKFPSIFSASIIWLPLKWIGLLFRIASWENSTESLRLKKHMRMWMKKKKPNKHYQCSFSFEQL